MLTSFSTAVSALKAHTQAIDTVGNNLANLNTTGYKSGFTTFHDLVAESIGTETQTGSGVRTNVFRQFSQGVVQSTSGALDVAIQGQGFLIVNNDAGEQLYGRGGHLFVDKSGSLRTSTGEKVQGWMAVDGTLNTNTQIGDIVVPVGSLKPPAATESFSLDLNLDASAEIGTTFSSPIKVYDSLGMSHTLTVDFEKTTENEWDYTISDNQTPPTTTMGTLTFGEAGKLETPASTDDPLTFELDPANGAAPMQLTWNLFHGSDAPRLTQFAQPSAVSASEQDGSASAQLIDVGILDGGQVYAQYSDSERRVIGQLAMASIRNPESLIDAGNSNYQVSSESALPAIGIPGTGGRGNLAGNAIESSNVDISTEFTNLIVYQRAYQANTRVIAAIDELSQDLINLKR